MTLAVASGTSTVGRWFAELAAREAASVEAFEILRVELAAPGAPRRLLNGARRAALDEVRHARVMSSLASRYGGKPSPPSVERQPVRSIDAIAVANAVEGCVRETFGALVGMWQARFAGDPRVQRAMVRVSEDEARHAAFSWEVAQWIEPKVSAKALRKLGRARKAAIAKLDAELSFEPDPEVVRAVGVPSAAAARGLLAQTRAALWSSPVRRAFQARANA